MSACLIIARAADQYAEELARQAPDQLSIEACDTAEKALQAYAGARILFGDPDLVAQALLHLPDIDWVQSTWTGVTPLVEIDRRDYVLTAIKDVFGPQMSEYVIGYLLAHELKVLRRMEEQGRQNWFDVASGTLHGKRLGIMGTGSIGCHIAQTAACFGMAVTGLSRSGGATEWFDSVLPVSRLHDFLAGIDYLVSTLPHTPATNNLLDRAALETLPEHAYFINVGRGNVVDETALIDALNSDRLSGAALDVFVEEPVPYNSPLWDTPNLSMTAHIAAISRPSLIVPVFLENYRRYVDKETLKYEVDFDAGY